MGPAAVREGGTTPGRRGRTLAPLASLALPDAVQACLFDLDGVITNTATVHATAWKRIFDEFLAARSPQTDRDTEFTPADYQRYVDGRPRADGVRTFLESRGIDLEDGTPDDPPDAPTVNGLANRKNQLLLHLIETQGVDVFEGSVRFVRLARSLGRRTAVVSSSANTVEVLRSAGIADLFDTRVDGVVAAERGLAGKPAPDTFLAAADALGVGPDASSVFEDALAGVAAGRAGGFAYVVGVDRVGHAAQLHESGADVVVDDLAQLILEP